MPRVAHSMNSANVTDPATGSPAISLPIDVVSSVKVISNPYDPEYGKLTGAVSNVETKTGNFDGYHFRSKTSCRAPGCATAALSA